MSVKADPARGGNVALQGPAPKHYSSPADRDSMWLRRHRSRSTAAGNVKRNADPQRLRRARPRRRSRFASERSVSGLADAIDTTSSEVREWKVSPRDDVPFASPTSPSRISHSLPMPSRRIRLLLITTVQIEGESLRHFRRARDVTTGTNVSSS